jgi:DNA replicative helicase MCM subunit Mcm2 (Cdc46/Mcm family)
MVKNSPAKATNAHISIVGHITRDELRRLLTQTESANGFANRFCWVAVRRSKCLPEGGAIHTVKFDEVIAHLQSAIDFAKDFVEIFRDSEAKKLWRDVYPGLSAGKPGMLGAITARAEAQVLRLSGIYALLDCSKEIRVDHLRAALSLWRYCEDSARWIFETGAGDKNADKILAALRVARDKGLTKSQITGDVFNRHATKFEIDEALRLLHSLKLATCVQESTAGRTAERWFLQALPCEISEKSLPIELKTGLSSLSSHPSPSQNTSSGSPEVMKL